MTRSGIEAGAARTRIAVSMTSRAVIIAISTMIVIVAGVGPAAADDLPSVTVTSPNGGEVWQAGSLQTVTWTSTNPTDDVSLYLVDRDDGYTHLGTCPMSAGSYTCVVPVFGCEGTGYVVRIAAKDNPVLAMDSSDAPFEIRGGRLRPTVTLLSPNGGEVWQAGTTQTIRWNTTDPSGRVEIGLYHFADGQWQWASNIGFAPMSEGRFDWTISPYIGDANDYRVLVGRLEVSQHGQHLYDAGDSSESVFRITGAQPFPTITLTSPNGGEVWPAGSKQTITWTSASQAGVVEIALQSYVDGEFEEQYYIDSVPASVNSYGWTVPCCSPGEVRYKIQLYWSDAEAWSVAESDGVFEISDPQPLPTVTLTSPNGGEDWLADSTHTITWTSTAQTGTFELYSCHLVEGQYTDWHWFASAPGSARSYEWMIPPCLDEGMDYAIALIWYDGSSAFEEQSDAPFQISRSRPSSTFSLISPVDGEMWQAGTTHAISWSSPNPVGNVAIQLIDKADDDHPVTLATVPMSDGRFDWQIPSCVPGAAHRIFGIRIDGECWSSGATPLFIDMPTAPADLNQDCFVDDQDLAAFMGCVTAPQIPYDPQNVPLGCGLWPDGLGFLSADVDRDGDVDQEDFGILQRCYSGPDQPADPDCAN